MKTFAHGDGLGSTRLLTDGAGAVVSAKQYDALGASRGTTGVSLPFVFTGDPEDAESGLVYLRARYLDPPAGRFLRADPLMGRVPDPISRHGYHYVRNNPVMLTDPAGLATGVLLRLSLSRPQASAPSGGRCGGSGNGCGGSDLTFFQSPGAISCAYYQDRLTSWNVSAEARAYYALAIGICSGIGDRPAQQCNRRCLQQYDRQKCAVRARIFPPWPPGSFTSCVAEAHAVCFSPSYCGPQFEGEYPHASRARRSTP